MASVGRTPLPAYLGAYFVKILRQSLFTTILFFVRHSDRGWLTGKAV
jgi:hypothetical protein